METKKLFSCVSDILSIKSRFSRYVASRFCDALSLGVSSFAIALPFSDALSFLLEFEQCLELTPCVVTRYDVCPSDVPVLFVYGHDDCMVYIKVKVNS